MKRANRRGFTLVEVLTIVAIVAVLAALILGLADHAQKGAARKKAAAEIAQLEDFLGAYQAQYGQVPPTEGALSAALQAANHPLAGRVDPWGHPYEYQANSPATFYLWSTGGAAVLDPARAIGNPP